ncbi:MAG: BlaI/MecI/CopY family transcriptional regulator [Acidimicrobiia bacterium]
MGERRPDGALEADILGVLWGSEDALTPGEVNEVLDGVLAYTTVMTVLTRLWKKGLVQREPRGRGYAYNAVVSEGELASRRIGDTLDSVSDRTSALASFVGSLSKRDVRQLRRLLGELDGPAR